MCDQLEKKPNKRLLQRYHDQSRIKWDKTLKRTEFFVSQLGSSLRYHLFQLWRYIEPMRNLNLVESDLLQNTLQHVRFTLFDTFVEKEWY